MRRAVSLESFMKWMEHQATSLNIVGSYNLLYNASQFVEAGFGYAIGLAEIINNDNLTFIPLDPPIVSNICIIWKKYQIFSKAAEKFLIKFKEMHGL